MATRLPLPATSWGVLLLLAVCSLSICTSAALGGVPPAKSPLEERLSRIIIPKIDLREATFTESLDFILHKVQELDPTGRAIKTTLPLETGVLRLNGGPSIPGLDPPASAVPPGRAKVADVRLTAKLANIPALEALKYLTSLANLDFRIDGDSVHFVRMDAEKSSPAVPHK